MNKKLASYQDKQVISFVEQYSDDIQWLIQWINHYWQNVLCEKWHIHFFLKKKLSFSEKQTIKDKRRFMFKQINTYFQAQKDRTFKKYFIVVLYIREYFKTILPFVQIQKINAYQEFCVQVLVTWISMFSMFSNLLGRQLAFAETINKAPNTKKSQKIKNTYKNLDLIQWVINNQLAILV